MLSQLLGEDRGKDVEISLISKTAYLSVSCMIHKYKVEHKNGITKIYNNKDEFIIKDADIGNIQRIDNIIYINSGDYKINLIIEQISSQTTLASDWAADRHTTPG